MGKMELDDFIKYAKEKFGCEVSVKMCEKPDTFADIFGASFLNDNEYMENIDDFEDELKYKNSSISEYLRSRTVFCINLIIIINIFHNSFFCVQFFRLDISKTIQTT